MAMVRMAGASPQMVRVPRRVPLSRVKGATPPRAASRWRLSVPNSGRSSSSGRAQTGPMPHTAEQLLALTPDRTRAQGGVQVVVERREALIEPGAVHLDIGLRRRRATEAVLFGGPHADHAAGAPRGGAEFLRLRVGPWPGLAGWPRQRGLCAGPRGLWLG